MLRLPIPIIYNEVEYKELSIIKPKGGVLADVSKIIEKGDFYSATLCLVSGCTNLIKGENRDVIEESLIKPIIAKIPYRSAEYVAEQIIILFKSEADAIEGMYRCPRCKNMIISEYTNEGGIETDTRDYLSNMELFFTDVNSPFTIDLVESVKILDASSKEVLQEIKSLTLEHPTLEHCINAYKIYGNNDRVRLQYSMYVQALKQINGEDVNNRWKNNFGMMVFEGIKDPNDLSQINKKVLEYGRTPFLKKECNVCNKKFKTVANTSNFFDLALET